MFITKPDLHLAKATRLKILIKWIYFDQIQYVTFEFTTLLTGDCCLVRYEAV